ncbi:MAG: NCS2 family permease [Elusimicrobia bacterium]|nr:NCS2 family permease [Elusimicrobiota bacterium]
MRSIDKYFKITESGSTPVTEIIAGLTTFLTMSYIIFVNPSIMKDAGIPYSGALAATVLVCAVSSVLMGVCANLPYGVAPGMGINAFFTYTLVLSKGVDYKTALGAVFISGIIFIILTLLGIRENIVKAIPLSLRNAVAAGIGIFIAFIGLQKAGMIKGSAVTLVTIARPDASVILFLCGLLFTSILVLKKKKIALLAGIIFTTVLGMIFKGVEIPSSIVTMPDFKSVFFKLDIRGVFAVSMIAPVFTFLFTDMFDSISTFMGVAQVAELIDEEGQPKNVSRALFVDALSTTISGLFGTSSGTTYIESAAGVEEGGRTGLTAVVIGLLFLPFLFFGNLAAIIPSYATAPALILVGAYMITAASNIDFRDFEEGIPAFLSIILIPLTYSITQGIIWGFISYTLLKVACGKYKALHPMMYVIFVFSVLALVYG